MKLIKRLLDTFDPYVDKIEEPMMKDIARVLLPIASMLFLFALISLPFSIVNALISGAVTIATSGG